MSEPTYRFRWEWVFVPLALIFLYWMIANVRPSMSWDQVMDFLNVSDKAAYSRLGAFCLLGIGAALIVKIIRSYPGK